MEHIPERVERAEHADDLTEANIEAVSKLEDEADANRTISDSVAENVADFAGSMTFVWVHVIWFSGWILANTVLGFEFDPFPFTFLTLIVSLEAIFLSTFILVTQNRQTEISERRNNLDLQVNLLAEQENTRMLYFLEEIAKKVGVDCEDAAFTEELSSKTDPDKLMKQLSKVHGAVGK